jgi:hypothetical protein
MSGIRQVKKKVDQKIFLPSCIFNNFVSWPGFQNSKKSIFGVGFFLNVKKFLQVFYKCFFIYKN